MVNEAYMRMAGEQEMQWQNRAHFFAIAAVTMRRVLLDYARQHHAGRRAAKARAKWTSMPNSWSGEDRLEDVVAVDQVLTRLSEMDPGTGAHRRTAFLRRPQRRGNRGSDGHLPQHREARMEIGKSLA